MVQEIQNWSEFENMLVALPKNQLVVLDCYASWCGPCKSIAPYFEELARKYPDCILLKANVEEIDELTTQFKVSAMPTFIFIKGVKVIDRLEGGSQSKLEHYIEKHA